MVKNLSSDGKPDAFATGKLRTVSRELKMSRLLVPVWTKSLSVLSEGSKVVSQPGTNPQPNWTDDGILSPTAVTPIAARVER